jgi:DNA-binding NarL/FixJ family response regulator
MKAKILIVEDDPLLARDLRNQVEGLDFEVMGLAESAHEALSAAKETRPDLALMDIRIDGSMDGIQTAQVLQDNYQVPVVFLTSSSDEATISRAAQTMPYGYLVKPLKLNDLKASIHTALHKSKRDAARETSQEAVSNAFNALSGGVITLSLDGTVSYMNAAAEKLLECPLKAAMGKSFNEILDLIDSRKHILQNLNDVPDFELTATMDQSGSRTGFVVKLEEAADRLRPPATEDTLVESHSIHLAPSRMAELDGDGSVFRGNRR